MDIALKPLSVPNLKDACVGRLEGLILSGELKIGERLPSERDLAARLGISRPVLHEALVDLAAKGLVRIAPRRGVFVNDFRTDGSLAILSSLLSYHQESLDPALIDSLMGMRLLLEAETARLAAAHRTDEHLRRFQEILARERSVDRADASELTELDFAFHLLVALASGNMIYPLIINSFKIVYTSLTGAFFHKYASTPSVERVIAYHARLVDAIQAQDAAHAGAVMAEMLAHGEGLLKASEGL